IAVGLRNAVQHAVETTARRFTASADGLNPTLNLTIGGNASFNASVTLLPAGSASTGSRVAAPVSFQLAGTPVNGDRWIVQISGVPYALVVDATTATLEAIGTVRAAAINSGAPQTVTTVLAGNTVFVVERSGAAFDAA